MRQITKKVLNATVTGNTDDEFTAYASVEVVDIDGDIIRIDGIDTSYQMPDKPIGIYPEHKYDLPSGMPATIGLVTSLEKTTHPETGAPALKFTGKWNGSDLGKAYKEFYDNKWMNSFSIGVERVEGKKIENGVDWTKTKMFEISSTQMPANQYANLITKTLNKYGVKSMSEVTETPSLNPTGVAGEGFTYKKDMSDMMTECMSHITKTHKDMSDMMTMHMTKCVGDMCKAMNERFDDIESAIAVGQDGPAPLTDSQKSLKELEMKKSIELKKQEEAVAKVMAELSELRKNLGK